LIDSDSFSILTRWWELGVVTWAYIRD